jgi:hypothetical protein
MARRRRVAEVKKKILEPTDDFEAKEDKNGNLILVFKRFVIYDPGDTITIWLSLLKKENAKRN